MIIPNASAALVERSKIEDYLLNEAHPDNGGKAAYFFRLGFTRSAWQGLVRSLCELVATNSVNTIIPTAHGTKYIVEGPIAGPGGHGIIRTVWIINRGFERPRLVTAYPL
jgi:hypothetical protein